MSQYKVGDKLIHITVGDKATVVRIDPDGNPVVKYRGMGYGLGPDSQYRKA